MSGESALLIDFGSTYTKLRAIDLDAGTILGAGQGPSTVTSDINVGLDAALGDLETALGSLPDFRHRLASSSAAGGLAMVTVGLVKELTAEAARLAALGAGAKLIGAHAYKLTDKDAAGIAAQKPDILLLAGGTDGGNEETIRWNAEKLAAAGLACPVIVAGNRVCADDVAETLQGAGIDARVAGNVMPEFNVLDVEPARAAIRDVFIERIVHAKGIDRAEARFDAVLMPTPAAVMEGARLLAAGNDAFPGWGDLLVVDVGGATTDVHSIAEGAPVSGSVIQYGLPEPYAKRTVEGDLGMRHNARTIVATAGEDAFVRESGFSADRIDAFLAAIEADPERLPENDDERDFDAALARSAVARAVKRHAGRIEIKQSVTGPVTVQYGKDLTAVGTVIGTGGVLVHGDQADDILHAALFDEEDAQSLRPKKPKLMIDNAYSLYAVGLLADAAPDAALRFAHNNIAGNPASGKEGIHGRSPAA
ncbi:MAG: glutamate mutase L [Rhodospirillales bacterium]|nr:glutamate mutase L [Rhodospirillales bacterium]MBO6788221.1 glutamate mutase L [Rhodospirillales bacterium]